MQWKLRLFVCGGLRVKTQNKANDKNLYNYLKSFKHSLVKTVKRIKLIECLIYFKSNSKVNFDMVVQFSSFQSSIGNYDHLFLWHGL